jgi:hypothetical protein
MSRSTRMVQPYCNSCKLPLGGRFQDLVPHKQKEQTFCPGCAKKLALTNVVILPRNNGAVFNKR